MWAEDTEIMIDSDLSNPHAFLLAYKAWNEREDLESSLRNLQIAYKGDLRRSERTLVAYPAAELDAKRKVLLQVNRYSPFFNNSLTKDA